MRLNLDSHLKKSQRRRGSYAFMARIPFAAFALLGMFGIVIIKFLFPDNNVAVWAALVFAIVCLLSYWLLVAYLPALRIREDQLGDNCYYLGFLYTLASLSMALYQFATASAVDDTDAISQIVANFGIALASTIVGILLRVLINQARKDVIETEKDARMALTEAMVNMRVQLDDAVIALRSFCAQTQQAASDAIAENARQANTALDLSVSKIAETSVAVLNRIEEAFGEFNENTKKLNQVAAGTVLALETLIDRLESMEPPSDLISKRLDLVFQSAEAAGQMLRGRLEADQASIATVGERIREIEGRMQDAAKAIFVAGSGMGSVSDVSHKAVLAAESAARKLTDLTAALDNSFNAQEKMLRDLQDASGHARGAILDGIKSDIDGLVGSLKSHNDAMAAEIDRARRMTADTGTALADMAEAVARRVEGIAATPTGAS
jgi:hypothetical protein